MTNNFSHLTRLIDNAGGVVLEEIQKDMERLIASNPPLAYMGEYICMLEKAQTTVEVWADQVHEMRRALGREFIKSIERLAEE